MNAFLRVVRWRDFFLRYDLSEFGLLEIATWNGDTDPPEDSWVELDDRLLTVQAKREAWDRCFDDARETGINSEWSR